MAFARIEQWEVPQSPAIAWTPQRRPRSKPTERRTYKLVALIGCLIVHAALFYLFALRLTDREVHHVLGSGTPAITLIDIGMESRTSASDPQPSAAAPAANQVEQAVPQESDIEASRQAIPSGWSVVRLVRRSVVAPAVNVASASKLGAAAATGGDAEGGGGGDGYDPYAGAAPLPLGRAAATSPPVIVIPPSRIALPAEVDRAAFEDILEDVCRRLPATIIMARFKFVVIPSGIVRTARIIPVDMIAPLGEIAPAARMFAGRRLFVRSQGSSNRHVDVGPVLLRTCR